MGTDSQAALTRAIYRILRPLVRQLMRYGVSYRLFADIARHVYVDVAEEDFALPGRKPSNARTSVLTGINRKDIAKQKERPHPLSGTPAEAPSPAARLIAGWTNDHDFRTAEGRPRPLTLEPESDGDGANFAELVRRYTSDVTVRALLDELIRIKAVSVDSGIATLLVPAYIPHRDMKENIRIFSTATADLLSTFDHNVIDTPANRFIQRTVSYEVPVELLQAIRDRSRDEGESFLLQINDWLARSGQTPSKNPSDTTRAGIGIYYFERPVDEALQEKFE